jgi:hypothetical protein
MTDDVTRDADRKLEEALEASGARDPREFYRERLRELKRGDAQGYEEAVAYYRETLLPSIARGTAEPLTAWTEYGRILAQAVAAGRTVSIDSGGKAHPFEARVEGHLVLHLPDDQGVRALLVGLPPELSDAQRATYDVLVSGKQRAR